MLNQQILNDLQKYINVHLEVFSNAPILLELEYNLQSENFTTDIEDFINVHRMPNLNQMLFDFIDQSSYTDAEIYKKAGIDRKLFSKIRSNPEYRPSKNTTIALALALELDIEDTEDLLNAAGYSLSDSNVFDLVIQYCLENSIHDIFSVNEALHHFNQKVL